jgi:hypothetical protein
MRDAFAEEAREKGVGLRFKCNCSVPQKIVADEKRIK